MESFNESFRTSRSPEPHALRRVRILKKYPQIKVYSVISDIGASGGYYIAAAADEIYADKASLVGSIGVISSSFGFVDVLKKLGIERRVLTAGEHKAFLDPFAPLKESEADFWKQVLQSRLLRFNCCKNCNHPMTISEPS